MKRTLIDSSTTEDLTVFITSRESRCDECKEDLRPHAWITLEGGGRALCLACADMDHLVFLPSGDTALTRRARKHSRLSAVVLKWSQARKRYERQGLLVEEDALTQAEQECTADAATREARRASAAERRAEPDQEYVARFAARVRELYPSTPERRETEIAEHACRKYSGQPIVISCPSLAGVLCGNVHTEVKDCWHTNIRASTPGRRQRRPIKLVPEGRQNMKTKLYRVMARTAITATLAAPVWLVTATAQSPYPYPPGGPMGGPPPMGPPHMMMPGQRPAAGGAQVGGEAQAQGGVSAGMDAGAEAGGGGEGGAAAGAQGDFQAQGSVQGGGQAQGASGRPPMAPPQGGMQMQGGGLPPMAPPQGGMQMQGGGQPPMAPQPR